MKTVCLDLDDFSIIRNRMDLLLKIKEHYPDFKVTLFTIPFDYAYETGDLRIYRDDYLKEIHKNLDWMQIVPHGLTHMPREFQNCDYQTMKDLVIPSIDEALSKDGLPYVKGFKPPFWLWNKDVISALDEAGWWGAIDRNQPAMLSTKKYYKYSHSLDEPFYLSNNEILKVHGHMTPPSDNNLEDCLLNIFKLPQDTKWVFATELLEEKK